MILNEIINLIFINKILSKNISFILIIINPFLLNIYIYIYIKWILNQEYELEFKLLYFDYNSNDNSYYIHHKNK